jgi:hypothetical protein
MITRSQVNPMPAYFDRYINMTDDVTLDEAFQISLDELDQFPLERWKALDDWVYAPGKWTVKDILQHLIDTERIFAFRALAFARKEAQKLPSYSEDDYAANAHAKNRTLENLIDELRAVRQSSKLLFQSFSETMLDAEGIGFKGPYSVRSIGFILTGHQRWHVKVLEEKYLNIE